MQNSVVMTEKNYFVPLKPSFVLQTHAFDKKYRKIWKKTTKMLAGIKLMCIFAAMKSVSGRKIMPSGARFSSVNSRV